MINYVDCSRHFLINCLNSSSGFFLPPLATIQSFDVCESKKTNIFSKNSVANEFIKIRSYLIDVNVFLFGRNYISFGLISGLNIIIHFEYHRFIISFILFQTQRKCENNESFTIMSSKQLFVYIHCLQAQAYGHRSC